MNKKTLLVLSCFLLVVIAQLFVPGKMILDREEILARGKEYKFRTAPIDPNDPFRGKFVILHYQDNTIEVPKESSWNSSETVYVRLSTDLEGFANIKEVFREEPAAGENDYLKATISYVSDSEDFSRLAIQFPFDRYFMEESKAHEAELTHAAAALDTSQVTYAVVNIKEGEAVLKDVMINGTPIRELVKQQQAIQN